MNQLRLKVYVVISFTKSEHGKKKEKKRLANIAGSLFFRLAKFTLSFMEPKGYYLYLKEKTIMEITITINVNENELINSKAVVNREETKECFSQYARLFNENSIMWHKDPAYNKMFVCTCQKLANDMLLAHGHLFLNEVYEMLGIPKTNFGQVVGWILQENNPIGDNYVDFGIIRDYNTKFVNGIDPNVILDFNVDGVILDRI